jgi:two-component system phosphate regulon response regulator PhoB
MVLFFARPCSPQPRFLGPEFWLPIYREPGLRFRIRFMTARGRESDRVRGLLAGADDYVVKPSSIAELVARVRALLRRSPPRSISRELSAGDLLIDLNAYRFTRASRDVHLDRTEFRLLEYLMGRPGRVFSLLQLTDQVWGLGLGLEERTVDVYIRRLRKALSHGSERDPIRTIRGLGYSFDETFGQTLERIKTVVRRRSMCSGDLGDGALKLEKSR